MVKRLVTNQDVQQLVSLKPRLNLCDTCMGCEIMSAQEELWREAYRRSPRHAIHQLVWACNQYEKIPEKRGRPRVQKDIEEQSQQVT